MIGTKIKKSAYVADIDLVMKRYKDKAFIYNTGYVDIIKDGIINTKKFKTNKDAVNYLMKIGWEYV